MPPGNGGRRDLELDELARHAIEQATPANIDALLRRIGPIVRSAVQRTGTPASDIDDVNQEVMLRVLRRLTEWNPVRGSFATWLYKVSGSAAIDAQRRLATPVDLPMTEEVLVGYGGSGREFARIEDRSLIQSVSDELRARRDVAGRRVLFAARNLDEAGKTPSIAAIAVEAELPESTARRAVERVRTLIEELQRG